MDWYNELSREYTSQEDIDYAEFIFKKYECKTLGDYVKIYLATDVNLLADVFENFRDVSLRNYKLDPAWYFTTPGTV